MKVLVHVVTFNSEPWIGHCLESLEAARVKSAPHEVDLLVTDNASGDASASVAKEFSAARPWVRVVRNDVNLGFSAAHNQGAKQFLDDVYDYLLVLNPDCSLSNECLVELCRAGEVDPKRGLLTPLLYRSDERLAPLPEPIVDAAGMILTSSLRHFDRGAGELLREEFNQEGMVFGGTGACLMLSRSFVKDALLAGAHYDTDVDQLYPELRPGRATRVPLFDEGFFAYREDADLCWRANLLGWRCYYVPRAVGYHRRRVVPENRSTLPSILNRLSVRNRFLLQIQNYSIVDYPQAFIPGVVVRNLLVLAGVLLRERSSLPALREVVVLWRRAWERRRTLYARRKERGYERVSWPRDCEACRLG